jgi:hypothetical protein
MKLGVYSRASETILVAYFINPSHQSLCLYIYPLIVARRRLGIHVPAATNIRNKEELLNESISMRCVSYQTKSVDLFVYPPYRCKAMAW